MVGLVSVAILLAAAFYARGVYQSESSLAISVLEASYAAFEMGDAEQSARLAIASSKILNDENHIDAANVQLNRALDNNKLLQTSYATIEPIAGIWSNKDSIVSSNPSSMFNGSSIFRVGVSAFDVDINEANSWFYNVNTMFVTNDLVGLLSIDQFGEMERTAIAPPDKSNSARMSNKNGHIVISNSWDKNDKIVVLENDENEWVRKLIKLDEPKTFYLLAISDDAKTVLAVSSENKEEIQYWKQRQNNTWELERIKAHRSPITSVSFSQDGTYFISTSKDNDGKLWFRDQNNDFQNLLLRGHTATVNSSATSRNGGRIATFAADNTVRIWEYANDLQQFVSTSLVGHTDNVLGGHFSADNGKQLITFSSDLSARNWTQSEDGSWQSQPYRGHTDAIYFSASSRSGDVFLTAGNDGYIKFWEISQQSGIKPKELVISEIFSDATTRTHDTEFGSLYGDDIELLALSNDFSGLVLDSRASAITAVHFDESGQHRLRSLDEALPEDAQFLISKDAATVAVFLDSGIINMFRHENELWENSEIDMTDIYFDGACISDTGNLVAFIGTEAGTLIYRRQEGAWQRESPTSSSPDVLGCQFSPDDQYLVIDYMEEIATVLERDEAGVWQSKPLGNDIDTTEYFFNGQRDSLFTVSEYSVLLEWKKSPSGVWESERIDNVSPYATESELAFSFGSNKVVVRDDEGFSLWTLNDENAWSRIFFELDTDVVLYHLAVSPDGRQIAAIHYDGTVSLWVQSVTSAWIHHVLESTNDSHEWIQFSKDGSNIIGWNSQQVSIWANPAVRKLTIEKSPIKRFCEQSTLTKRADPTAARTLITSNDLKRYPDLSEAGLLTGSDVCDMKSGSSWSNLYKILVSPFNFNRDHN